MRYKLCVGGHQYIGAGWADILQYREEFGYGRGKRKPLPEARTQTSLSKKTLTKSQKGTENTRPDFGISMERPNEA